MATFKPFGFQGAYSTSAASIAKPTLLSFPWNVDFSGWSGDLAVQYLPKSPTEKVSADGYVYPAPISFDITPPSGYRFNYPPIVGVIVGFKYTPTDNAITPNDTWSSYIRNTEVVGNKVEVIISTDAQARYLIQYNGTTEAPGVTSDALFGAGTLGAGATYPRTLQGIDYVFAQGTANSSTSTANGQLPGTSTMCMASFVTQTQLLAQANYPQTKSTSYPMFIQTQNNYNGTSGWYDPANIDPETTNTIVAVMLNPSFMITGSYPMLEQQPASA